MRVALITESARPYPYGGLEGWCDRLVRGMPGRDFSLHVLAHSGPAPDARALPGNVREVHAAALWDRGPAGPPPRGRRRRAYREHHEELVRALAARDTGSTAVTDRFSAGLHGLAALAREDGALTAYLRSDDALRSLESACRAPGALPAVTGSGLPSLLASADVVERGLRPLTAPWYADASVPGSLAAADLCHAVSGGPAALPGLLAARWFGTPLLVTEYGVSLRDRYVAGLASPHGSRVRALASAFHRLLAGEVCRGAALLTPGNARDRRWQERCGADRTRIRTVYPAHPEAGTWSSAEPGSGEPGGAAAEPGEPTLVWVGRPGPEKDLFALLHAFAEVRGELPGARLRIIALDGGARRGTGGGFRGPYAERCRVLAAQLFPDEARDAVSEGESPVTFEAVGTPEVPEPGDAYAAGSVVVSSSTAEAFPRALVEAMFCGRATVSTDVGAVREVIGGTGLVVPPRNPKALAAACTALLRDGERRERLGEAARARAQELFTAERNLAAFDEIYLELVAHCPVRAGDQHLPFARPAEARLPGTWSSAAPTGQSGGSPRWVAARPVSEEDGPSAASERGRPGWAAREEHPVGAGAVFGGVRP